MEIRVSELSLVLLVGASGSGKSTFARKHFASTEILSGDFFRAMISDDETNQSVSGAAFEVLHHVCTKRLGLGKFTVIDATNVLAESRRPLLEIARMHYVPVVAIVLKVPPEICFERNRSRGNRNFGPHVIENHTRFLEKSLEQLNHEGFKAIHILESPEQIDQVQIVRIKEEFNLKEELGPFDIIGDVHGCFDELIQLLTKLGYDLNPVEDIDGQRTYDLSHPQGRKLIFVGDLVDRGPKTPEVLRMVMRAYKRGLAYSVRGNHEDKLLRKMKGNPVKVSVGLQKALDQLATQPAGFSERVLEFLDHLPFHIILDQGRLVVAHAGLPAELQGRIADRVRAFCLYGATTGEMDSFGLPVRLDWSNDYHGFARVVYGHTPSYEAFWKNKTICIDTGCVFGGKLTALRYPSLEIVSVPALQTYMEPKRPMLHPSEDPQ